MLCCDVKGSTGPIWTWRRQRQEGTLQALAPRKRGRKAKLVNPLTPEVKRLQRENRRLKRKLEQAESMLDIQKQASEDDGHLAADEPGRRRELRDRAMQLSQSHPTAVACRALGVPRASLYRERRRRQFPREVRLRPSPPRTLSGSETEEVAHLLHSRRFVDNRASPLGNRTAHARGRSLPEGGVQTSGAGSGSTGRLCSIPRAVSQRTACPAVSARSRLDQSPQPGGLVN